MNNNLDSSLLVIQIMEKVQGFYNNAWDKLWLTILIGGGIVGVIVPLLISWYQTRFYKIEEEKIKRDIIKESEKFTDKKIENEVNAIDAKIDNRFFELDGKLFHLQACVDFSEKDYLGATRSCLYSLKSYVKSNDGVNLRASIESLGDIYLPKLKQDEISEIEESYISQILDSIIEKYGDGSFDEAVKNVKKSLKNARERKS